MLNGIDKIEGLTDEQKEAINNLSSGLSDKNAELLGKLASNEDLTAAEKAKLSELETFKSNADIKTAKDAEDWQVASDLQLVAHNGQIEKIQGVADIATAQLKVLLIDNGLSAALDAVNINKDLKSGAIAMLHSQCTISEGKAMIGEKSLSEAVKAWSETDIGKAYTLATDNSGTGAEGGKLKAKGEKLTLTEQAIAANAGQ